MGVKQQLITMAICAFCYVGLVHKGLVSSLDLFRIFSAALNLYRVVGLSRVFSPPQLVAAHKDLGLLISFS